MNITDVSKHGMDTNIDTRLYKAKGNFSLLAQLSIWEKFETFVFKKRTTLSSKDAVILQSPPQLNKSTSMHTHGEGNGAPLQYSCLENPMDGGAW